MFPAQDDPELKKVILGIIKELEKHGLSLSHESPGSFILVPYTKDGDNKLLGALVVQPEQQQPYRRCNICNEVFYIDPRDGYLYPPAKPYFCSNCRRYNHTQVAVVMEQYKQIKGNG